MSRVCLLTSVAALALGLCVPPAGATPDPAGMAQAHAARLTRLAQADSQPADPNDQASPDDQMPPDVDPGDPYPDDGTMSPDDQAPDDGTMGPDDQNPDEMDPDDSGPDDQDSPDDEPPGDDAPPQPI